MFAIKANEVNDNNFYVQSASLNGKTHTRSSLSYSDIYRGGELKFNMGSKPSTFGIKDFPSTSISDNLIVLNPVIEGGEMSFKGNKSIRIYSDQEGVNYYYTTDGSTPTIASKKYTQPITINNTTAVKAIAVNNKGEVSYVSTANYFETPHNWAIKLKHVV